MLKRLFDVLVLAAISRVVANNPTAQREVSASGYEDAEKKKLRAALDVLTNEIRSQQNNRNQHDQQVLAIDRKRLGIERILMWTTVFGLLGAATTLIFVKISADAARDAARAAMVSMRPIVLANPQGRPGLAPLPDGRLRVQWNFLIRNYGTFPAIQVASRHGVFFGKDASAQVDRFFSGLPERLPNAGGVIEPTPSDQSPTHFDTARSQAFTTEGEFIENLKTIGFVQVAGRIEYHGVGSGYYRTDFCFQLAGAVGQCPKHYEMIDLP